MKEELWRRNFGREKDYAQKKAGFVHPLQGCASIEENYRFRILQTYSGKSRGTYTICQHSQRAGHIICTLMSGSIYQPYIGRGTFSHWTRHNSPHTNFRTCRSQLYWYGAPWLLCQPLSATRLSHNLPAPSSGRIIDPHQWHFIGWRLVRGLLTHGQS